MPYDSTFPANGANMRASDFRDQLNALNGKIPDVAAFLAALHALTITNGPTSAELLPDGNHIASLKLTNAAGRGEFWMDDYWGFVNVQAVGHILKLLSDTGILVECGTGLRFNNLATSDPHVAGQVWNNAGALMISAG